MMIKIQETINWAAVLMYIEAFFKSWCQPWKS